MTTGLTTNYKFPIISTGDDVNTWGQALNLGTFSPLDAILGSFIPVTMAAGSNTISAVQFQNLGFALGSAPGADSTFVIPLSANPATPTVACGGMFIVVNDTTGAGNVTVLTAASGSVGVIVPQGAAAILYSDGTDVQYANNGLPGFAQASNGNPNGRLAGTGATANSNASLAFDYINNILYVCTLTGSATGSPSPQAIWINPVTSGLPIPQPEGYLTVVSATPIILSNAASQSTLYYTPFKGGWSAINSGAGIVPFKFSQMSLALSSSQASNQIYDIFMIYSGGTPGTGTPVIASGVAWTTATAGSGNRGTGGGSAQIQRDASSGLWVNAQQQSMIYSNGAISGTATVPIGGGVYLGSIWVDASAGQVSCYRSYGQALKFGVWNAYNQSDITLIGGDPSGSWTYFTGAWRISHGNANNFISSFVGLQEVIVDVSYSQNITYPISAQMGIGLNTTTGPSGTTSVLGNANSGNVGSTGISLLTSTVLLNPGINTFNMLEFGGSGSAFFGTNTNQQLTVRYKG